LLLDEVRDIQDLSQGPLGGGLLDAGPELLLLVLVQLVPLEGIELDGLLDFLGPHFAIVDLGSQRGNLTLEILGLVELLDALTDLKLRMESFDLDLERLQLDYD
jgi:hypothetical protein